MWNISLASAFHIEGFVEVKVALHMWKVPQLLEELDAIEGHWRLQMQGLTHKSSSQNHTAVPTYVLGFKKGATAGYRSFIHRTTMSVRRERGWNSFNGRIVRRGEFADQRLLEKIVDANAHFVARFLWWPDRLKLCVVIQQQLWKFSS